MINNRINIIKEIKKNNLCDFDENKRRQEMKENKIKLREFMKNIDQRKKISINNFNKTMDEANNLLNNLISLEEVYKKLTNNKNNKGIFDEDFPLYEHIKELENNKLNKYNKMIKIGDILENNTNLNKKDLRKISSINNKTRPARYIRKFKRLYILNGEIDVKTLSNAEIGNWIRDKSDIMFDTLLSLITKQTTIEQLVVELSDV